MKQNILSTDATLLTRDGFVANHGLTVAICTDSDGDQFIRINSTLHLVSDVMDERGLDDETLSQITDDTERLFLCASGQTVCL
jgi:hypothetical protein